MKKKTKIISDTEKNYRLEIGTAMVATGMVIFIDQYLHTGWLTYLPIPIICLFVVLAGIRNNKIGLVIAGSLLSGVSVGAIFLLPITAFGRFSYLERIGIFLISFGLGWCLISLTTYFNFQHMVWWALVPGFLTTSLGACFIFSQLRLLDFLLYSITSLGISLLVWGAGARMFGIIIPGSILIGIGPGIYLAWATTGSQNALTRTGIMLVSFALGWGVITLIARWIIGRFAWWPLIPGGILAMVGWGLHIAGSPSSLSGILSNAGSIGLIIFGFYLLLLRKGIRG
jgi:hypothetical protein